MEKQMLYAEIILPLPLKTTFTYIVPTTLQNTLKRGMRVLVPLGIKKKYVGIVEKLHNNMPDYKCKNIIQILDEDIMANDIQLKLWNWISYYYISPIGDVFNAALPAGLKSIDKYKPKTEKYLVITEKTKDIHCINQEINNLRSGTKLSKALSDFAKIIFSNQKEIKEVSRNDFKNLSKASNATINTLINRELIGQIEKEESRLLSKIKQDKRPLQPLSIAQQKALISINNSFNNKDVTLLNGVTSSGKTEIYIHLINNAIKERKQVLFLLPEIALTFQIMQRLKNVFGDDLGIYHSKYSDAERVEVWKKQLSNNPYKIILGARSAVFLPFKNLSLVIIDEEHETSFKQTDPSPRYHARSVAIVLASYFKAKTLLGTATPSAETWYNATKIDKYGFVKLTTRYKNIQLPAINIVDMKDLRRRKCIKSSLSPQLYDAINKALNNDEQVILFQNIRGYAPIVVCKSCLKPIKCVNCDVSLTFHKNENVLICHSCGKKYLIPKHCPYCHEYHFVSKGLGTEKIENIITEFFPKAKVMRMDLDTITTRSTYEKIIEDFEHKKYNILIGTQMVTKGLNFTNVSTIGILNAGNLLNKPMFRAYEYAFQMMIQVSGRAGRHNNQGNVFIQTNDKDLKIFDYIVNNNISKFYEQLLNERKSLNYPPYSHIIVLTIRHKNETFIEDATFHIYNYLTQSIPFNIIVGPYSPPIERIKQMHVRNILFKMPTNHNIKSVRNVLCNLQKYVEHNEKLRTLQLFFDVDPI